jgi:6-aminohexanoate-oligomer endohydrolase
MFLFPRGTINQLQYWIALGIWSWTIVALPISQGRAQEAEKTAPKINDTIQLTPITAFRSPVLEFDFPGVEIGIAEYEEGPTGCTVFYFPKGAISVIDVRGGLPGTLMGSSVEDGPTAAIGFAGGSVLGFEAMSGIMAEIFARGGYKDPPRVRGAILWDYGLLRDNMVYPDKALGRAALKTARPGLFPLGPRGAGRSATVGKWLLAPYKFEPAGQGGAFYQDGPTKIAVFAVVNSGGAITDRAGKVVRGHLNSETGVHARVDEVFPLAQGLKSKIRPADGNTTLTLVVTNQQIDLDGLRQLARQVHSSMARAIYPFHTILDGDVLFAATTGEVKEQHLNPYILSHVASELAWEAVLHCFATEAPQ